jgi:ParB family transcriptional regulator, chromosome partitioning protein
MDIIIGSELGGFDEGELGFLRRSPAKKAAAQERKQIRQETRVANREIRQENKSLRKEVRQAPNSEAAAAAKARLQENQVAIRDNRAAIPRTKVGGALRAAAKALPRAAVALAANIPIVGGAVSANASAALDRRDQNRAAAAERLAQREAQPPRRLPVTNRATQARVAPPPPVVRQQVEQRVEQALEAGVTPAEVTAQLAEQIQVEAPMLNQDQAIEAAAEIVAPQIEEVLEEQAPVNTNNEWGANDGWGDAWSDTPEPEQEQIEGMDIELYGLGAARNRRPANRATPARNAVNRAAAPVRNAANNLRNTVNRAISPAARPATRAIAPAARPAARNVARPATRAIATAARPAARNVARPMARTATTVQTRPSSVIPGVPNWAAAAVAVVAIAYAVTSSKKGGRK